MTWAGATKKVADPEGELQCNRFIMLCQTKSSYVNCLRGAVSGMKLLPAFAALKLTAYQL